MLFTSNLLQQLTPMPESDSDITAFNMALIYFWNIKHFLNINKKLAHLFH